MQQYLLILYCLFLTQSSLAQDEALFERLRAIHNRGTTFYNIDGVDFTSENISSDFTDKLLKKAYRKYKVKKQQPKSPDSLLPFENYKVIKKETLDNGLESVSVYYFVKNLQNRISIFWFGYYVNDRPAFERKMIALILNDKIPDACFSALDTEQVNFAGRMLNLGGNCAWMNINNIQCPYNGQLNWSIHPTQESAALSIQQQLKATKAKSGGQVISEEEVQLNFEQVPTEALKVTYDLTGINSLLASLSGGKQLTVYYISEKVRGNYVSCVLSHWNNDKLNPSGLPALLEKVMQI